MGNENKNEFCKCDELAEKLGVCVKDNEKLAKMMRDLRLENEELNKTLRDRSSGCDDSRSGTTRNEKGYKEKFEALVEINHGWKKDYEGLQMRYEMLKEEKRLLEDEEKELKTLINELENRQGPLQSELARLATTLYVQHGSSNDSNGNLSEEQCEMLKWQIIEYKEDFERERKDRERIHKEKEKYKKEMQDAEKMIRKLTAELDVCKAREEARQRTWAENGYLSVTSPSQQQLQYPNDPVDGAWRQEQQRKESLPRNHPVQIERHFMDYITMIL